MSSTDDVNAAAFGSVTGPRLSRRTLLLGSALGAAAAVMPLSSAFAAPSYTAVPLLPYETSRLDTQTTTVGKKKYEEIDVVYKGDTIRLFVPHTAKPFKSSPAVTMVWYYHSNGSTHTSLSNVYKYSAMLAVDKGWVCVCPLYGGSLWTNNAAAAYQKSAVTYLNSYFNIGTSFLRANSGGGSLLTGAYGTGMVPKAKGIYLANGTYDMEDLYARDPGRIGPVYDNDPALVAASNPARLPQSAWTGSRIRAVVSQADFIVPPAQHGQALVEKADPVAAETSLMWHNQGHVVPDVVSTDMIKTFARWLTV
ncbi:hypothetical protein [Microbacterium pumilum]|uniref:Alpha/beta hydrolase n=1 Tax=Microbacterium pumilum TaxID=344165 RepID=A0ABN2SAJ2_9MICO